MKTIVKCLVKHGFKEATAFGFDCGELGFQPVAYTHHCIRLGDDGVFYVTPRKLYQGKDLLIP